MVACRRLTILDGMILVGASAVGFALARAGPLEWASTTGPAQWKGFLSNSFAMVLTGLTLAIIPLRLIPPRPSRLATFCQPGMAAACALASTLAVMVVAWGIYGWRMTQGWLDDAYIARFWRLFRITHGPLAIPAVWVGLGIAGRWRPERGWIDRLGIGFGSVWIVVMVTTSWPFSRWFDLGFKFLRDLTL